MLDGQYGCIFTLNFMMISGDGPKARELVAQSSSLHTLAGLGDRQVADMVTARADAVDAAPESMEHALRADAAPMQEVVETAALRKRKRDVEMAKVDVEMAKVDVEMAKVETEMAKVETEFAEYEVRREQCGVRRKELKAQEEEAEGKIYAAQAMKEAARQALEESRQKRRLAEAEA